MSIVPFLRIVIIAGVIQCGAAYAEISQPPIDREQTERLHNELRDVKARLIQAVNQKNITALTADLSNDVTFTAINNDSVIGVDNVKSYYDRMMLGADSFLNDFSIAAEADDLSKLYANNTMAIATGGANVSLDLRGGSRMKYTVPTRWTATLDRSSGQWKLAAIHFSTDIADNPYLTALSTLWKWISGAVGVIGLAAGYMIGRRFRRPS